MYLEKIYKNYKYFIQLLIILSLCNIYLLYLTAPYIFISLKSNKLNKNAL